MIHASKNFRAVRQDNIMKIVTALRITRSIGTVKMQQFHNAVIVVWSKNHVNIQYRLAIAD